MKLSAWVSTFPPPLKTLFYSMESAMIVALILPLTQIYTALSSSQGFHGLSWATLLHDFFICLATGLVKAMLDYLKSVTPSPAPPAQSQGAP